MVSNCVSIPCFLVQKPLINLTLWWMLHFSTPSPNYLVNLTYIIGCKQYTTLSPGVSFLTKPTSNLSVDN